MHVVIFENPAAGRALPTPGRDQLATFWRDRGWHLETRGPQNVDEMRSAGAHPPDADLIIVNGGDGTLSAFIQDFPLDGPLLAVLPSGTANVVARDLGLPLDTLAAGQALVCASVVPIDFGEITWADRRRRRFVLSAGAGAVAQAVSGVSAAWKKVLGRATYAATFLNATRRTTAACECHGARRLAGSVIVKTTRHYAGGFVPTEVSQPGDGALDVYIVPPGWAAAASFANAVRRGIAQPERDSGGARVAEIRILSDGPIESDGDPVGRGPCSIRIAGQLRMLGSPRA